MTKTLRQRKHRAGWRGFWGALEGIVLLTLAWVPWVVILGAILLPLLLLFGRRFREGLRA